MVKILVVEENMYIMIISVEERTYDETPCNSHEEQEEERKF